MVSEKDRKWIKEIFDLIKVRPYTLKALYVNTSLSMTKLYQLMPIVEEEYDENIIFDPNNKAWKYTQKREK